MSVYVFLAPGFEEVEALTPVDVLRRAGLEVSMVAVGDSLHVSGSHGITVIADALFSDIRISAADVLLLPGGMPGAANLDAHQGLGSLLVAHVSRGGVLAAICAAPMILGKLGLLRGKQATCYPGYEKYLEGAICSEAPVVVDQNLITARGVGAALAFSLAIVGQMLGPDVADEHAKRMVVGK